MTKQIAAHQPVVLLSRNGLGLLPSFRSSIATADPKQCDKRVRLLVVHALDLLGDYVAAAVFDKKHRPG